MDKLRDWVPFTLLDDLPLDFRQRATIKDLVSEVFRTDRHNLNLRRQLFDCLAHGVVEVFQQLPVQSSAEGSTDVGAGQTKFDAILLVGHRLLYRPY